MPTSEAPTARPEPDSLKKAELQRAVHKQAVSALKKVWHVPGLSPEQRSAHARGINERLRELECQMGLSKLSSWPNTIELPVAGNCDVRCEMCSLSHGAPIYKFWGLADVERFGELFKYSRCINPTGIGEPLMAREFFPMLEVFKQHGNVVGFYTNGTLLNDQGHRPFVRIALFEVGVGLERAKDSSARSERNEFCGFSN